MLKALAVLTFLELLLPSSAQANQPRGTYILTAPPAQVAEAPAGGRIIFMNRHGGVYTPGNDNSGENSSAIPTQTSTVSAWSYGDEDWAQLMTCMRDVFAPFNVEIVDTDPGQTAHVEAVIGGMPSEVQVDDEAAGVASSIACDVQERGVVFAFSEVWREFGGGHIMATCVTAAQEVGHAYGLDHQLTCGDPMTYLQCQGSFEFHDEEGDCGEDTARACTCAGTTQNSYQQLLAILGASETDGDPNPDSDPDPSDTDPSDTGGEDEESNPSGQVTSGCSTSGGTTSQGLALLLLALVAIRNRYRGAGITLGQDAVS